jgi:hypothetical protein
LQHQARRAERRFAQVRELANVFLFDLDAQIRDIPGTIVMLAIPRS